MKTRRGLRSIFVRVLLAVVGAAVLAISLSTAIAATLVHDDKRGVIVEAAIDRADSVRTQLEQRVAIARAELRAVALAGTNGMVQEVPRLVSGNILALRCTSAGEELVDAAADRTAHDLLAAMPVAGRPLELLGRDRLVVRINAANAQVIAVLDVANLLNGPPGWRLELVDDSIVDASDASSRRQVHGGTVVARIGRGADGYETMRVVAAGEPSVVVTAPLGAAREAAAALTRRVLLLSGLVLLPLIILAGLLARAVTRPVRSLAAAVWSAGDGPVVLPALPGDEIGDLGSAIETMSRRRFDDAQGLRAAVDFARRSGNMVQTADILAALAATLTEVVPTAKWRVLPVAELAAASDLPLAVRMRGVQAISADVDDEERRAREVRRNAEETPLYRQLAAGEGALLMLELYGGPATHALVVGIGVHAPHDERIVQLLCSVAGSALRQAELALVATDNEKLAALGRLAAGVAHEINNALSLILANIELLEASAVGEMREVAADVRLGADRVALIVDDLSSFSRGGDRVSMHAEDLGAIVRAAVKHASARRPGITIEVIPFAQTSVTCDAARMEQVVINLLGNAADAALSAGRPQVRVAVQLARSLASVEITDRGGGIPAAVQARIFEPFYTTKGNAGTGLGLFISRTFARAHGGDISVLATGEEGTTIALTIPLFRGTTA